MRNRPLKDPQSYHVTGQHNDILLARRAAAK
jgi:hypothetical protein